MAKGTTAPVRVLLVALVAVLGGLPGPAAAQSGDDARRPRVPAPPPSDFMIGRPRSFVTLESGFLFANTGSDLYDFVTEQLTLDKKAFNTPVFGGRLGVSLSPRFDVMVGVDVAQSRTPSEYRDFVDNKLLPITQTTERKEVGVSASVRYSLVPTGRRISRFAWVPRTVTPYVGAGGGLVKYRFEQNGDFVDFATRRVFSDVFESEGWAPSAHAFAGTDIRVWRHLYLTMEGRYTWSKGTLSDDFVDFAPLALAGARLSGGFRVAF